MDGRAQMHNARICHHLQINCPFIRPGISALRASSAAVLTLMRDSSSPAEVDSLEQLEMPESWDWNPDSSRLTLQLLRAAKHKQIGREEKKKKNLNLTFTRWHSCDSNSTTCMCMFGNMQQCMTAANSLICLETDSHKMPACNLIAPLN